MKKFYKEKDPLYIAIIISGQIIFQGISMPLVNTLCGSLIGMLVNLGFPLHGRQQVKAGQFGSTVIKVASTALRLM
ncbi:hypothetical protein Pgy4_33471 [Pseudomonas savastanoi pv. glycinea str. race 4]|uniref:Uncharacterized protein n=1 Tax=Pseudomonas savastanoi pv. glycinea str. race 4 TaxID=875330 RepID=F3CF26_PSESG|nr:hypothetical protein Pgy4_33471 [Pseudomonas savastanoi pv. glycinea str. race 4]